MIPRPETEPSLISTAPRDGTKIIVERRKRYTLKYVIVKARWDGRCWRLSTPGYAAAQDDDLIGWWP